MLIKSYISKRNDEEFLSYIKTEIERINHYIGRKTYKEFLEEAITQDAVIHNLEIKDKRILR